jgi:hypothetical protein
MTAQRVDPDSRPNSLHIWDAPGKLFVWTPGQIRGVLDDEVDAFTTCAGRIFSCATILAKQDAEWPARDRHEAENPPVVWQDHDWPGWQKRRGSAPILESDPLFSHLPMVSGDTEMPPISYTCVESTDGVDCKW